jgi:hypothetical protein
MVINTIALVFVSLMSLAGFLAGQCDLAYLRAEKVERRKKRRIEWGHVSSSERKFGPNSSSSERMLLPPPRGWLVGVEYSDQRCFAAAPFDADQPPTLKVG